MISFLSFAVFMLALNPNMAQQALRGQPQRSLFGVGADFCNGIDDFDGCDGNQVVDDCREERARIICTRRVCDCLDPAPSSSPTFAPTNAPSSSPTFAPTESPQPEFVQLIRYHNRRVLQVTTAEGSLQAAPDADAATAEFVLEYASCPSNFVPERRLYCVRIRNKLTDAIVGCSLDYEQDGNYPCQLTNSDDLQTSRFVLAPYQRECDDCYTIQQAYNGRYIVTFDSRVVTGNYETAWEKREL